MDIDELRVKISIEPENFKLLCLLGRLYEDKGMYSEAINVFTKAIIINDRDSNTFCSLGKCYFKIKEIEKGVHAFLKAVELDSDNFYALQNLANYYLKEKNYDLAKPICEKLLSIDKLSDFFDLIKLAKRNNDMQFLKKLYPIYFHKQPNNLTVARYYINYLMEENFNDEAEKLILDYSNRFVLDEKNTKKFNNMLITVYLAKNEYNNAKNKIIQLINENRPVSSVLLTNYAIATKDSDLAVSYITQFLSKNPYQVENWEQLMNIYHACGE
jgi:tetratricopeptide (TPR) repeat protein